MIWYLLVLVLYSSFWGFLGWGLQGETTELVISLSILLTSVLIAIFNFKNTLLKEALTMLYSPSMIVFAIIKRYDSMSTWRIIFIVIAIFIQAFLLISYYKAKKNGTLHRHHIEK